MIKDLHPLTKKLLKNRGVVSDKDIEKFLNPSYERDIGDPFTIYGMEKAVKRIIKAIKDEEKIIIYSDYDCDGIPGGVILRDFFDVIGYENVEIYIPHRHNEGYGLHKHAIDKFKKDKVTLMITVDSGITNVEEVKYAEDLGINVIVTDHHLPVHNKGKQVIPKAYCVLNSKQDKCDYHDDMLCGCAVAWKLSCATLSQLRNEKVDEEKPKGRKHHAYNVAVQKAKELPEGYEKWWLDLVAVSTIADMVPLLKENRTLAYFGLKVLQKTKRFGLLYIFRNQGVSKENLTEDDIAFTIAPRINAAGRMGHPLQAHNMLYEKDSSLAQNLVADLEFLNSERKGGVKDILSTISFDHAVYKERVVVVGDESWSPGVLGLIAQKIIEETGKPTFVWGSGEDKDVLKGSCRSTGDVHVVDLMKEVGDILVGFGGHEQAGGFSFKKENKDKLLGALNEAIDRVEIKKRGNIEIVVDEMLAFSDVNDVTYEAISVLAPFGIANSKPVFSFPKTKAVGVRRFGKTMEHIEVMYGDGARQVKAIKFFVSEELEEKLKKEHVLLAHFEKSYFRGKGELRLRIVEVM